MDSKIRYYKNHAKKQVSIKKLKRVYELFLSLIIVIAIEETMIRKYIFSILILFSFIVFYSAFNDLEKAWADSVIPPYL